MPARHLHGGLDALGAAVAVEELLPVAAGHQVVQLLSKVDVVVVEEVGVAVVYELVRLVFDGFDHFGVAVADAADRQTRVHVDELVAVHVDYYASFAALDDKGVRSSEARGDNRGVPVDDLLRLRARRGYLNLWIRQF